MQLNQLNHLKKDMQGIEAISDYTSYRRRTAKQQNNMNNKSEYDRLIGELSQTTITPGTRDRIEKHKRDIKAAYQGSQYTSARNIRNKLRRGQTSTYRRRAY